MRRFLTLACAALAGMARASDSNATKEITGNAFFIICFYRED